MCAVRPRRMCKEDSYRRAATPPAPADLAYDPTKKSATLTLAQAVPDLALIKISEPTRPS